MTAEAGPWTIRLEAWTSLWTGRRLSAQVILTNRSAVASIPEPRHLRPTLRDVHNHALAVSDIYRPDEGPPTIFRPVVQPGGSIVVRLRFERLPDDRAPEMLTFGASAPQSILLTSIQAAPTRRVA